MGVARTGEAVYSYSRLFKPCVLTELFQPCVLSGLLQLCVITRLLKHSARAS